jgi:hypothetical protein
LIADLEDLADRVDRDVLEPLEKAGHHLDYYDITNKAEEYSARIRKLVQGADEVRKEFIRLSKLQVLEDPVRLTKSMHKHFDGMDVHQVLERRR